MSTSFPAALGHPALAPTTPATRTVAGAPRRRSWWLAAAVVLAVLALGLLLIRVDATPRTQLAPAAAVRSAAAAPAAASSLGHGPAAAAVTALVTAPAGQDPLAAVPADFASMMGYTPVAMRMADGTVRLAKPTGACSVPGGGAPFGFQQACQVHDYGYDLLRYADATGQHLTAQARRQLDAMFGHDLRAGRQATSHGLAGAGHNLAVELFTTGVAFNSWRQRYGNPARESAPGLALGLAVPALAVPCLPRRRGARARRAGGRARPVGRLRALLGVAGGDPGPLHPVADPPHVPRPQATLGRHRVLDRGLRRSRPATTLRSSAPPRSWPAASHE